MEPKHTAKEITAFLQGWASAIMSGSDEYDSENPVLCTIKDILGYIYSPV